METKTMSFRDTIILAMSEEMRRDENVFLMGEDVGVFGGDFGTSVGMLEEFGPERVRDCPISEAAISGAAAGAAMTGLRPIVDMTFMDFSVIAMDNIVNQAAKTRYMFGGKGQVPMTVRCAAGNGVGSAAQHSQSLESWFTHIPGLKVVAPGTPADMKGLLKSSIRDNNPVIILEYKSEFNQKGEVPVDPDYTIPLGVGEIKRQGTDVTVVTYGKMLRRVVQAAEELAEEGISVEIVDPRTLVPLDLETKSKVVNTLVGGVAGLLRSYGVTVHKGIGTITKDKNVLVNGSELLETKKIILAGGSKVSKINVPGMESPLVMTSDDILEMNEVPESLVIIGGGVVGIELGQAFMTFGSKVTVIEMMDRIVPAMDVEVSKNLRLILERKGMTILTGTKLQEIIEENGQLRIKVEGKDDIIASKALLSIGRMPDLEGIGEVEFELDRGCIKVNEYMETSVPGIYAPGDINGTKMLAHAAFRMGEVSAENALKGNHAVAKLNLTPAAIYTLPEVAAVGLTEEQAREKYDVAIGKFNFAANGRAIASDAAQGFVKVIADKKYGEILGVHIIGPAAAELINEASSIIEMEITVEEMLKTIHGHPTYSEVMYEAFADVLGMAIHSPKKK